MKFARQISESKEFIAYIDAIGKLDGTRCLIEWKTTSSRYPEEPDGLLALDLQLVCYSWMTGISEVAQVVFGLPPALEICHFPPPALPNRMIYTSNRPNSLEERHCAGPGALMLRLHI